MTCPFCGYRPRRCSRCGFLYRPERRDGLLRTFGTGLLLTVVAWAGLVLWLVAAS